MNNKLSPGVLYIVATPIGNLADMSTRAISVLKQVDIIAAEDTRHSRHLLKHFDINTPMLPFHDHNEQYRCQALIQRLHLGQSLALIVDAGTPLISDPGYQLVKAAHKAKLTVSPLPGPCAAIAALSVAGLATDRFYFEGFLPSKKALRIKRLQSLKWQATTIVFYESPHRIIAMLNDIKTIFSPSRQIVIARELTKKFETIYSGDLQQLLDTLETNNRQQLGEFVVIVEGNKQDNRTVENNSNTVLNILLSELPLSQAVDLATKITGASKNSLYKLAIDCKTSHTNHSII